MGLFQKNNESTTKKQQKNNLPEYVDTLLEEADLDSVPELGPQIPDKNPTYGINKAIELMRRLPKENTQLVVSVVMETLSSANIDVNEVISDGETKISDFEQRLASLGSDIDELNAQIDQKKKEISELEANLEETQSVQNLLQSCSDSTSCSATNLDKNTAKINQIEVKKDQPIHNEQTQHLQAKAM